MKLEGLYNDYENIFCILAAYYNNNIESNILGKRDCDKSISIRKDDVGSEDFKNKGDERKVDVGDNKNIRKFKITAILAFLDLFFEFSPDTADLNEIFILLKIRFFKRYEEKNTLRTIIKNICDSNSDYLKSKNGDTTSSQHLSVVKEMIFNMMMSNYLILDAIKYCWDYYKQGLVNVIFIPKLMAAVLIGYMYMFSIGQNLRYILDIQYLWIFNIIISLLLLVFVEAKDAFISKSLRFGNSILLIILGIFYSFIYSAFFNIVFNRFLGVHYSIFSIQNLNAMTIAIVGGYITQAFWSKELITKI